MCLKNLIEYKIIIYRIYVPSKRILKKLEINFITKLYSSNFSSQKKYYIYKKKLNHLWKLQNL